MAEKLSGNTADWDEIANQCISVLPDDIYQESTAEDALQVGEPYDAVLRILDALWGDHPEIAKKLPRILKRLVDDDPKSVYGMIPYYDELP